MGKATDRQRVVEWVDPRFLAEHALELSGLEFLRRMIAGELPPPPVGLLINMFLVEVEEGRAVFTMQPDESHFNPIGSVHGGMIATICDSAASCAVQSLLPAGQVYTTLEMKVNYIRPITHETGLLRCTGTAIHSGRRIGIAEARLEDENGKLYAHATVTCLILQG